MVTESVKKYVVCVTSIIFSVAAVTEEKRMQMSNFHYGVRYLK